MKHFIAFVSLLFVSIVLIGGHGDTVQAKAKTYTISPTSAPLNEVYAKYTNYNKATKHYYLLTSYLEEIEKNGGGTLVLKKGSYTVSNTLNIPSNTTIKLQNGAVLKKGQTTGNATFQPSKTFLQFVPSKNINQKASVKKYAGAKNIKLIGSGKAVIDLTKAAQSPAILMAHAQNITISGIEFKNNNQASFIHIYGSKNIMISKNKFLNATAATTLAAIRLETASNSTTLYSLLWSAADQTVNTAIDIKGNTFTSQFHAIKTVDYLKGKTQKSIVISKNKFSKIKNTTIYMTAWSKPQITNNVFDDTKMKAEEALIVRAVSKPTIKNNQFIKTGNVISFKAVYRNNQLIVADTANVLTATNKKELAKNTAKKIKNHFILLPKDDFVELVNKDSKNNATYKFNKKTASLNPAFERYSTYSAATKPYYVLRSILERLEMQGGGKLIIQKGTYTLTNNLYIPSNVTIELEDGVILKKSKKKTVSGLPVSSSIFQLVPPSKADRKHSVGSFKGTQNVKIYSKGRAKIDLQHRERSFGIIMGHNTNITVKNIDFVNLNGGHFIEMDATKNTLIDNCSFISNITTENDYANEAINLDTPDLATKGFNSEWSNFDRTANSDVTIQNSKFKDLVTAIGTHQISGAGVIKGVKYKNKPHKNVKIINNQFLNIRSDAIHAFNWSKPVIKKNDFIEIGKMENDGVRGIVSNGSYYPTYEENYFENISRPMQFYPKKNANNATEYEVVYDKFSQNNLKALENNQGKNLDEYFIRISDTYQDFSNAKKIAIKEVEE